MLTSHRRRSAAAPAAAVLAGLALLVGTAAPAGADPIGAGEASAYGTTISVAGQELVPPTPTASATLGDPDASETTVDVPADPVAVSGTLNAFAAVHPASDLESSLTVVTQPVDGPYNAKAVGSIENAEVLLDALPEAVSLVTADAVTAEAVAVCRAGAVEYSAASEIINLNIGGSDVPLNAPLQDVIDQLNGVLEQTTLDQVVDIERNVITETPDGIAVDALVVTVLAAAGDPVAQVRLGQAEVNNVACAAVTQCNDTADNDGDGVADTLDPGCHPSDGDATNPDSYDPTDNDEADVVRAVSPDAPAAPAAAGSLPVTGGDAASTAGIGAVMAAGALAIVALRRRLA